MEIGAIGWPPRSIPFWYLWIWRNHVNASCMSMYNCSEIQRYQNVIKVAISNCTGFHSYHVKGKEYTRRIQTKQKGSVWDGDKKRQVLAQCLEPPSGLPVPRAVLKPSKGPISMEKCSQSVLRKITSESMYVARFDKNAYDKSHPAQPGIKNILARLRNFAFFETRAYWISKWPWSVFHKCWLFCAIHILRTETHKFLFALGSFRLVN